MNTHTTTWTVNFLRFLPQQKLIFAKCAMALALADRYASLSFQDCLSSRTGNESEGRQTLDDPLVDSPLTVERQRTFAVPPGIEV